MTDQAREDWPGRRLNLPPSGVGAIAGFGVRLGAFIIDVLLAAVIALIFTWPEAPKNWSLLVWALLTALSVGTVGATPGQFALRIRVATFRAPGSSTVVGLWAVPRTILVGLVVPVLLRDSDGRALHDRLCHTVVVRAG